jgi:hypothetical protein
MHPVCEVVKANGKASFKKEEASKFSEALFRLALEKATPRQTARAHSAVTSLNSGISLCSCHATTSRSPSWPADVDGDDLHRLLRVRTEDHRAQCQGRRHSDRRDPDALFVNPTMHGGIQSAIIWRFAGAETPAP